jgi:hypothetical protein
MLGGRHGGALTRRTAADDHYVELIHGSR